MTKQYWEETLSASAEEHGVVLSSGQLKALAEDMQIAHEMYGEAHGHYHIPNPLSEENEKLRKELAKERAKKDCRACGGIGRITTPGPYHSGESQCMRCSGAGRI